MPHHLLAAAALVLLTHEAAALRFASVYSDHMVLQHGESSARNTHSNAGSASIWGFGTAGAAVSLTLHAPQLGQTRVSPAQVVNTTTAADGTWQVLLAPVAASSTAYTISAESTGSSVHISDVLFGSVWICGGTMPCYRHTMQV